MITLGIDSATKTASVGIVKDEKVVASFTLNHKRTHSEKLLEMVDMALKVAQLDINEIDAFAVTKGPGSFTGLRIGLATIKGLCHALNKPCYPVSTIDALYENVSGLCSVNTIIAPIMDARRGEVYCGAYLNNEKILEDDALNIEKFIEKLKTFNYEKIIFTGDGVEPNKEIIKNLLCDKCAFAPEHLINGSGEAVIFAALKNVEAENYDEVRPEYLRVSQAERLKKEI